MIRISNYTVEKFEREAVQKKIICFCGGQKFRELCAKYHFEQNLLYVVDNYTNEKVIVAGKRYISILRMDEVREEVKQCILILTSIKYADEIITQLDGISLFNNLLLYIPELFGTESDNMEFEKGAFAKIPKRIHYCWFGSGKMPEMFRKNIETWRRHCQDYEILRWDEGNYDVSKNRYMKQAYEAKKWGFVSDYARIDIINSNGGIYLDTDVEVLRSWDDLLYYDLFCGFESPRYVAFGLGFGATKNHPILEDILDEYECAEFSQKGGTENLVPCPIYQTRVLEKYGLVRNGKTQMGDGFIALSPEYLSPLNQYGIGKPSVRSFSIHQYAATWIDSRQRAEKEKLSENYKYVVCRMAQELGEDNLKLPWGCP